MLLLLLWSMVGLAQVQTQQPRYQRIIAIGGALTEIVYALGAQHQLVAVDSTSLYPAEALQRFPDVGYLRMLSAEPILALAPDLVMAVTDAGPPQVLEQLRAAGVQLVMIPDVPTMTGIHDKIAAVATLVNRSAEGDALIGEISEKYARTRRLIAGTTTRPAALFLLSVAGAPLAAGSMTAADSMITLAGGRNVLHAMQGYKPVSPEAIVAAAPEYIIIPQRIFAQYGSAARVLQMPELAATPAAANRRLLVFDGLYFTGFGPRTVDAILDLARQLHPDLAATD